jgi:hypothetical protein
MNRIMDEIEAILARGKPARPAGGS